MATVSAGIEGGSRPIAEREIQRWAEARGVLAELRLTYLEANRLVPGSFVDVSPTIPNYLPLIDLISTKPRGFTFASLGRSAFERFWGKAWVFLERQAEARVAALAHEREEDLDH